MEINIPDIQDLEFIQLCPQCGGQGEFWSVPDYNPMLKRSRRNPAGLADPKKVNCTNCERGRNGLLPVGQVPTDVGRRLMDFLKQLGVLDSADWPKR